MLFRNYHPLGNSVALRLNKHEFLLPKRRLVPPFVKIGHVVLKKDILSLVGVVLLFSYYISLKKKGKKWPLNIHYPKKFFVKFVKFGWNWPCGSGEECFLIPSVHFSSFVIISPLAKCVASFGKKKRWVLV